MTNEEIKKQVEAIDWWHSIEIPGYGLTPGREPHPRLRDGYMNIPKDLTGKYVLDIGAWDGLYSFVAEERGADCVLAVDTYPKGIKGIALAKYLRKSKVSIYCSSIYDLDYNNTFDVVFMFGLLYHVEDPIGALKTAHSVLVTGGLLILETDTWPNSGTAMYFRPGYADDPTNVWYPTEECIHEMLVYCGFEPTLQPGGTGNRRAWHCIKK